MRNQRRIKGLATKWSSSTVPEDGENGLSKCHAKTAQGTKNGLSELGTELSQRTKRPNVNNR
jgi:hypothetical protein